MLLSQSTQQSIRARLRRGRRAATAAIHVARGGEAGAIGSGSGSGSITSRANRGDFGAATGVALAPKTTTRSRWWAHRCIQSGTVTTQPSPPLSPDKPVAVPPQPVAVPPPAAAGNFRVVRVRDVVVSVRPAQALERVPVAYSYLGHHHHHHPLPPHEEAALVGGDSSAGRHRHAGEQAALEKLRWMLQKERLGQDVFLVGTPGPSRRRLALWFCEALQREVEYVRTQVCGDLQDQFFFSCRTRPPPIAHPPPAGAVVLLLLAATLMPLCAGGNACLPVRGCGGRRRRRRQAAIERAGHSFTSFTNTPPHPPPPPPHPPPPQQWPAENGPQIIIIFAA
jgi:hypothetical protein